jgi:25S rRNA (uracil2634-N3)-methyltransferase
MDTAAATDDDKLLHVHPATLACALTARCVPCLYKLFPDGVVCSKKLPPNQRPENCPRAAGARYEGLYTAQHRLLTVGDGDFSFSLSIARGVGAAGAAGGQLTATSHESLEQLHVTYGAVGVADKLDELRRLGAVVRHGVDATDLAASPTVTGPFDVIAWNFPCVRAPKGDGSDGQAAEIDVNKQLLRGFFRSARAYLAPHQGGRMSGPPGQLHVAHKTIEPFSWWGIEALAAECGFAHVLSVAFDRCLYPGYVNRKVLDRKSFPSSDARVFVFVPVDHLPSPSVTRTVAPSSSSLSSSSSSSTAPLRTAAAVATALGVVLLAPETTKLVAVAEQLTHAAASTAGGGAKRKHTSASHGKSGGSGGCGSSSQPGGSKRPKPF